MIQIPSKKRTFIFLYVKYILSLSLVPSLGLGLGPTSLLILVLPKLPPPRRLLYSYRPLLCFPTTRVRGRWRCSGRAICN